MIEVDYDPTPHDWELQELLNFLFENLIIEEDEFQESLNTLKNSAAWAEMPAIILEEHNQFLRNKHSPTHKRNNDQRALRKLINSLEEIDNDEQSQIILARKANKDRIEKIIGSSLTLPANTESILSVLKLEEKFNTSDDKGGKRELPSQWEQYIEKCLLLIMSFELVEKIPSNPQNQAPSTGHSEADLIRNWLALCIDILNRRLIGYNDSKGHTWFARDTNDQDGTPRVRRISDKNMSTLWRKCWKRLS